MLLLRGATPAAPDAQANRAVSIHAPLARSNVFNEPRKKSLVSFNTCSSCEEQLACPNSRTSTFCFNTCSSCEEQQAPCCVPGRVQHRFNTCSSCEEQLEAVPIYNVNPAGFQYMLLLRGATESAALVIEAPFVSIHAPLARSN